MRKIAFREWHYGDILISGFIFAFLLWFTYGIFIETPYAGFFFNPPDGRVERIYEKLDLSADLQVGDILEQVGPVSWDSYRADRRQKLFENMQPGEIVEITVRRNGLRLTIPWVYPGFNQGEFIERFINVWWLAYIFWLFGMLVQLLMRPRDMRWKLLVAANYLTGIWLIAGSLSTWHMWESSIILHAVTWLILPVYLTLHWIFPKPLGQMPSLVTIFLYLISGVLAFSELLQLLPRSLYFLGFFLALAGSVLLLGIHFVRQPAQRRGVGLLTIAILIAVIPPASLSVIGMGSTINTFVSMSLLSLPIMPMAYFYVIYRQQLGGSEVRVNRIISIYLFLILLGTILFLLILPLTQFSIPPEAMIFLTVVVASITAFISILIFPSFQALLEQRLMGIKLPYQNLQENYSSRITTSASLANLLQLLDNELIPSLLIRQFAFIHLSNGSSKALLIKGTTDDQLPSANDIDKLIGSAGRVRASIYPNDDPTLSWIRLILPLKIGADLLGLWLLGRRDPDDLYPQAEIPILQSLANQTAIALSNILQTERLRNLYQENINRYEQERLRLALDLHDSVLNQMAVLSMNLDPSSISPKFKEAYDELIQRLREIVSDLRPPMLQYGLKPAFEGLSDNLMERSNDKVSVMLDIEASEDRYHQNTELHLFRMAQEACENAMHHGQAGKITISGQLDPQRIQLIIEDDGIGFETEEILDLNSLLANKHFGLAGIVERANLIGAQLNIDSTPKAGTRIKILLNVPQHDINDVAPSS